MSTLLQFLFFDYSSIPRGLLAFGDLFKTRLPDEERTQSEKNNKLLTKIGFSLSHSLPLSLKDNLLKRRKQFFSSNLFMRAGGEERMKMESECTIGKYFN